MALTNRRPRRKSSGGRYIDNRHKKKRELAGRPTLTGLGARKSVIRRVRGSSTKTRLLRSDVANVYDPKSKKYFKVAIKTILENPANRHFVRRNIMTKGTIIETEKGKARIVSRPGQENTVNAVLI